ncbi:Hint domain-containing protein [Seohaeicola saemankumensis]|uniref:Hint domain-containing protein n=1 Tax=Seohaeicola saemankumensis TaxID=481181 RepID=UPI001E5CD82A|nr:Hint domain-containing protein [Seohaeicola saemankumensis]MCD1627152.1 Hint domain-containing protein [Seohaeicola saemankumensis]
MAYDAPSARFPAVEKTTHGITLPKGMMKAAQPLPNARDASVQIKTHCETPRRATVPARVLTAVPPQQMRRATLPQAVTEPRKPPVMRRYEVSYLTSDGHIDSSRHVAPATAQFESAFSAFARGTLLTTSNGLCAIEDLVPGMEIETSGAGRRRVLWIGCMTILPDAPVDTPDQTRMTRLMADTFGLGRPMADVMAGPGARLLHRPAALRGLDGTGARSGQVFTPVADFEDGSRAIRITPPRPVTVYHLCLDQHAAIKVAGIDMESYHPGPGLEQRMGPNTVALFLSLFPHIRNLEDFGPLAFPRATLEMLDNLSAA